MSDYMIISHSILIRKDTNTLSKIVNTLVCQTRKKIMSHLKALRLLLDLWDCHLRFETTNSKHFFTAIKQRRKLLLSPTGSGKSLIIYGLVRWHLKAERRSNHCTTVSLVSQLTQDFKDYGWKADHYVHQIMGGQERYVDAPVVISTWQSIYKDQEIL